MDDLKSSGTSLTSRSSPSSSTPPVRQKHKRAPAGKGDCCRTCRLRKVRCSGNPGTGEPCTNCARLELYCGFKDAAITADTLNGISRIKPSNSHTEAGTARRRAQRACAQCHAHKTRCSGDTPQCKRCAASNLTCEYNSVKRRKTAAAASPANAEGGLPISPRQDENPTLSKETGGEFEASASRLPHESVVSRKQQQQQQEEACFVDLEELTRGQSLALKDILKQHFDAYMEYMFYLPSLSFLHPASTYKAIEEGTLPPALGAAICAVVSPLLKPCPAGEDFGARCIDQVELHIWRSMHTFSDNTFILLALGLMYDFTTCSFAKAWQSIGVGLRLMLGLQANWEASPSRPSLSPAASPSELFIKQECRRRAVWFFFVFDRILAGGYDAYVSCQRENMKIGLPCDDQAFLEGQPKRAIRLDENPSKASGNIGIVGFAVLMMDLRHKIESYSRTLACDIAGKNSECDLPSTVMSDINDLQNSLSQLHTALPARLRLSQRSIATHMSLTEKNVFVWFHTHFFTAHIDLYRFALPGFHQKHQREILKRLPKDFIEKSQRQAVAHAIIMARFCEDIMEETRKLPARPTDSWQPRRLAGDMTITLMATQSLRVLLVALQYRLYEGLDLAEHSTVPLWRLGSATGPQIRQLVDSLIKISEPWAEVWHMSRYVHQQNVAMVEHFDKTHRFTDRRGTVSYTASTINQGSARLPGAHFMLDSFHLGDDAREQRKRAHEAAAQSWWARRGSHAHQSSGDEQDNGQANVPTEKGAMGDRCAIADREAELEAASIAASYAPPGVPMALAHARGDQFEMHDLNMLSMEHSFSAWQQATGVWPMLDLMALQQHSTPGLQSAAAQLALMPQQQSMSGEGPTAWPPVMPDPGPYFATPGQVVAAEGSPIIHYECTAIHHLSHTSGQGGHQVFLVLGDSTSYVDLCFRRSVAT